MTAGTVVAVVRPVAAMRPRRHAWRDTWRRSDSAWALAFAVPYAAIFLAFVLYPVCYGLWMGSSLALYADLFDNPHYLKAVLNTAIYVGVSVNLKMGVAFLLSGFFMRKAWWVKPLLVIFILPWATPALPAFLSIHWMLNGTWGLLNSALFTLLGVDGPIWLIERWLALGANISATVWKQLPFWTVIFLAGRMAIPQQLYEAAAVDGARGVHRFRHITLPLLANLYIICTLLSTIWTLGEFNAVFFISGGGPAMSTEVLATLGIRYAFTLSNPPLGIAAVISALPLLLPVIALLIYRLRRADVQL